MYATSLGLLKHGTLRKGSTIQNMPITLNDPDIEKSGIGVFKQIKDYFNNLLNNFSEKID